MILIYEDFNLFFQIFHFNLAFLARISLVYFVEQGSTGLFDLSNFVNGLFGFLFTGVQRSEKYFKNFLFNFLDLVKSPFFSNFDVF